MKDVIIQIRMNFRVKGLKDPKINAFFVENLAIGLENVQKEMEWV